MASATSVLVMSGSRSSSSVARQERDAIGVDAEPGAGLRGVVDDDEVEVLGRELRFAVGDRVVRLEREADDDRCPARRLRGRRENVRRRRDAIDVGALAFLILELAARRRPKVGRRGGHDQHVRRREAVRPTAAAISSVDPTACTVTARRRRRRRAGRRRDRRSRRAATPPAAIATPILPLLWFEMKRTGSIASRVGPAVTTTRRPASATARLEQPTDMSEDGFWFWHAPRTAALARGQRAVSRARARVAELAEVRDVALRLRVRPHVVVHRRHEQHRATGGEQRGREQVVRLARRGARQKVRRRRRDDDRRRRRARARCGRARAPASNRPVCTGRPVSASKVTAPTNSCAARVITTSTSAPAFVSSRASQADL